MIDAEKVIKGLETHSKSMHCNYCNECPYRDCEEEDENGDYEGECTFCLTNDALGLLKERKEYGSFIVIDSTTGKEADVYNIALHEDWAKHLCYCDMDGWAIQDDGSLLLLDECGRYAYADKERFKVKWDD